MRSTLRAIWLLVPDPFSEPCQSTIRRSSIRRQMKFLYLIQGKAENVVKYLRLNSATSCLHGLTYDVPQDGFDYLPKSSFAEGRNHLYGVATKRINEFDYFIFIDDDVEFQTGSFHQMETNLAKYQPSVGVPLTAKTRRSAIGFEMNSKITPLLTAQRFHINDEQYLGFRRDVVKDGKILPYLTTWDSQSWFVCCLIQEALIQHFYFNSARQFNNCEIRNDQHSGDYPHNLEFAAMAYTKYMDQNYPERRKRPAQYETLLNLTGSFGDVCRQLKNCLIALSQRTSIYRRIRGI